MIKILINRIIFWVLGCLYQIWRRMNRGCDPRKWSNDELRKFAGLFSGSILNVSAGEDKDKEKGLYKHYFKSAKSYLISNYQKTPDRSDEIELDLNVPIPQDSDLISGFDVVFSHTVLEHVYDIFTAVDNLCVLSRDIVITIIPFLQAFHHRKDMYHDYWRLSPYSLVSLFHERNFKTIYINWNNDPLGNIYLFHIASKKPEKWNFIKERYQPCKLNGPGHFRQILLSHLNPSASMTISVGDLFGFTEEAKFFRRMR